jgi:hypothetical protein
MAERRRGERGRRKEEERKERFQVRVHNVGERFLEGNEDL